MPSAPPPRCRSSLGCAAASWPCCPYRPPWLTLDYGFIYLRNRTLAPAALRFMAVVREIEVDLGRRNRALIDEFYPGAQTAPVAPD